MRIPCVAAILALPVLGGLFGCDSRPSARPDPLTELQGDTVARILAKVRSLPSRPLEAHVLERRLGDGELGPSDARTWWCLRVRPEDVPAWTRGLEPLTDSVKFEAPDPPRPWWVGKGAFDSMRFYRPGPVTGGMHGWLGVTPSGTIAIHTFTM